MPQNAKAGISDDENGSPNESREELRRRAVRAEECCARIQARLDESQRIAHLGSWEWEIESNHLSWSKETYHIFGLEPGSEEQDNYASFIAALHPEDRLQVGKAVREALQHRTPYSLEYRIIRADNQRERILHAHAETIRDPANGQPLRMVGTIQDVTARRQALQKLEQVIEAKKDIIMGTGHSDTINREEALTLGIKEFYNKPLGTDRLVRLVRKVLDENRQSRLVGSLR